MSLRLMFVTSCSLIVCWSFASTSRADLKEWDAGGFTSLWSEDANWSPDEKPQADDDVVVDGMPMVVGVEQIRNMTNNGTIFVGDGTTSFAALNVADSGTISGSGEVVLRASDNELLANASLDGGGSSVTAVTNAAEHTIRGEGLITGHWINFGKIVAEERRSDNQAVLLINSFISLINHGTLRSSATASLEFAQVGATMSPAGNFVADSEPIRFAGNNFIVGGALDSVAGGKYQQLGGTLTLSGTTLNGNYESIRPAGGGTLEGTAGGITNHGSITLDGLEEDFAQLTFRAPGTLGGNGELVLVSDNLGTRIAGSAEITQGSEHTIRGAGYIAAPLVNHGRIQGNSPAEPIRILNRLSGAGVLENVRVTSNGADVGIHAPGNGVGQVDLEGDYTIDHADVRLEIELGGLTPGTEHDFLNSTGTVNLDGTLAVSLVDLANDYVPAAGDRFTIIESTSDITGTFANEVFPSEGLGRLLTWDPVDYSDPKKVVLEIAAVDFLESDLDQDGDVDSDDLGELLARFGDELDGRSFLDWQRHFGSGMQRSPDSQPVPEPSAALLLVATIACTSLSRNAGRRAQTLA